MKRELLAKEREIYWCLLAINRKNTKDRLILDLGEGKDSVTEEEKSVMYKNSLRFSNK